VGIARSASDKSQKAKLLAEAEPLLLKGYEGMKQRADTIPPLAKGRLLEAGERIVELYETTNRSPDAEKLRAELLPLRIPPKPPSR
jgi:hypothetical protein